MRKLLSIVGSIALAFLIAGEVASTQTTVHPGSTHPGSGGGGDTLPIVDTTAVVKGSADATKLARFEADGISTGTTRVYTLPNVADKTMAYSEGQPGGIQLFGRFANTTNGGIYYGGNSEATASSVLIVRAEQTPDATLWGVNDGVSRAVVMVEDEDLTFDFGHANPAHPTFFVHSSAQSTTQFSALNYLGVSSSRNTVTVDAATTFALTSGYIVLACTGAETINTITGGTPGAVIYIENTDTECTLADDENPTAADAMDLTGAANDVGAVAKVITLIYNGTHWLQTAESDN